MPNAELNTLELEFLFLTNFDLHVKRQVLAACSASSFPHERRPLPLLRNRARLPR